MLCVESSTVSSRGHKSKSCNEVRRRGGLGPEPGSEAVTGLEEWKVLFIMHFSLSPLLFPSWLLSSSLYIRSSADTSLSCLILRDLVHIQARHGPQVLTWQFLVRFSYEFSGSNSSCQGTSTRSGSWSEVLLWQFCPLSIPPCHGTGKLTFKPSLHCLPAFLNAKATDHSWVWNHLFAQAKRKSQAAQITWPVHPSDTPSAGASVPADSSPVLALRHLCKWNSIAEPAWLAPWWVSCARVAAGQRRPSPGSMYRRDRHFALLQSRRRHPRQTCISVQGSVFHHLFFIALILNRLQQMKGILSGSGASPCWSAPPGKQACWVSFYPLPWETQFNKT